MLLFLANHKTRRETTFGKVITAITSQAHPLITCILALLPASHSSQHNKRQQICILHFALHRTNTILATFHPEGLTHDYC